MLNVLQSKSHELLCSVKSLENIRDFRVKVEYAVVDIESTLFWAVYDFILKDN